VAPGYGFLRGRREFRRGEESVIEFRMEKNHAAAANGAVASGTHGTDQANLIDGTENTNWTAPGDVVGGNLSVDGKTVTIDLAGTKPVRIRHLNVSAMLRNGQNRFTALRQFDVWACNDGGSSFNHHDDADCTQDSGYRRVYTSRADAFPGDPPRPVAPHVILRSFDIPSTTATHLRLVVRTSQCTGGPLFQGEQDLDPTSTTDCDSNVPAGSSRSFVRAAEFQAFEDEGSVRRR
jgi:extracellular elastinolytic metalloproteinase